MAEREPTEQQDEQGESILTQAFVEAILTGAQENLRAHGRLLPVLFLHLGSGARGRSVRYGTLRQQKADHTPQRKMPRLWPTASTRLQERSYWRLQAEVGVVFATEQRSWEWK